MAKTKANFTRTKVNRCRLVIDDVKTLEIGSFSVTFQQDTLPQAEMVPALGKEIITGKEATLEGVQEDQVATLILTVNGEDRTLLKGRMGPMLASDSSTVFTRQLSAKLTLIHEGVKLMGLPALAFGYANSESATLLSLSELKRRNPLTGETTFELVTENAFKTAVQEKTGNSNAMFWPGSVIKAIFDLVAESEGIDVDVDTLVKTYDSANLTKLTNISPTALSQHIYNTYKQLWLTSSSWDGARAVLQFLYLHIVPFSTGFYIADTLSLLTTPDIIIPAEEYLEVSEATSPSVGPRVDGVIMRSPVSGGFRSDKKNGDRAVKGTPGIIYAYPPLKNKEGGVNVSGSARLSDKYYHFREMPHWIGKIYTAQFGKANSPVGKGKGKKGSASKKKPKEKIASYYDSVGASLAKYAFAELKSKNVTASFTFPFREDLMPGTVVQIDNSNVQGLQFLGNTLHGMVKSTTIRGSMLGDSPSLNTFITVEAIRGTEDNKDVDNGGYGLSEHPIYEKRWVGINLDGSLLKEEPEHEKAKNSNTRKTNNANSGGKAPQPKVDADVLAYLRSRNLI